MSTLPRHCFNYQTFVIPFPRLVGSSVRQALGDSHRQQSAQCRRVCLLTTCLDSPNFFHSRLRCLKLVHEMVLCCLEHKKSLDYCFLSGSHRNFSKLNKFYCRPENERRENEQLDPLPSLSVRLRPSRKVFHQSRAVLGD